MERLTLPPARRAQGTVRLPGSKSITNRALLLAALCGPGSTVVRGALDSDDTRMMIGALQKLKVPVHAADFDAIRVPGRAGQFSRKKDLFLGNAGTAFRPLTAVLAFSRGRYRLLGTPRMHERPVADLVESLRAMGAKIDYLEKEGFPPLAIQAAEIAPRQDVRVRGGVSSQFLSALLMALPLAGGGTVRVEGELISKPYVEITLSLMRRFGVDIARRGWEKFTVSSAQYRSPGEIRVEGDASSASYFLAAGAIAGGPVRVEGAGRDSIQGDVRFCEVLERMGAEVRLEENAIEVRGGGRLEPVDLDLNHIPDAAMTAAVAALFARGPSTIRNIASWRVKETDRIAAMATELRKFGAEVEEGPDFLRVAPPPQLRPGVAVDTYDDHRMAMCFSLASLGGVPVTINDPGCVAKTFPDYFKVFSGIVKG
ncbi:MAG TPA: 3-phosphoshikimate 1-carboxyvinyltransferase [Burkholderiales bacterium]|nr:3-phosphoshikimate 1-carboxyvinyltransferase [Burkholderiales bacterium]